MVKLVLAEDAALGDGGLALGGLAAHIVALRKSEPSLEDVFVELVGRGFGDAASTTTTEATDSIEHRRQRDPPARPASDSDASTARERGPRTR